MIPSATSEGSGPAGRGEGHRGGGALRTAPPSRVCRDPPCVTRPTHASLASPMPGVTAPGASADDLASVPGITASWRDTVKLNGAHKAREMFSERGTAGWGGGATLPAGGGPAPASRLL